MTASTSTPLEDFDRGAAIEAFVHQQATRLWRGYYANSAREVAELAQLRRGLPRGGVLPLDAWPIFEHPGFDERLAGRGDHASRAELAIAAGLALFARHQQSRRTDPMHWRGFDHGLGRAAFALNHQVDSGGVERRMQALARAHSLDQVLDHLRALVGQLRAHGIALDHARLARDLDAVQHPVGRKGVRTRWSRDFYRSRKDHESADEPTSGEQA